MTIPLFRDYENLAPYWFSLLKKDEIITHSGDYNITNGTCCFVGEIYNKTSIYSNHCNQCYEFAMTAQHLMLEIPKAIGIKKWSTPKSEFKYVLRQIITSPALAMFHDITAFHKRINKVIDTFNKNEAYIETYRDLFNACANDYINHLASCETYVELVGLTK